MNKQIIGIHPLSLADDEIWQSVSGVGVLFRDQMRFNDEKVEKIISLKAIADVFVEDFTAAEEDGESEDIFMRADDARALAALLTKAADLAEAS